MSTTFSLANVLQEWTFLPVSKIEKQVFNVKEYEAAKINFRMALKTAKRFEFDDEFTRLAVERSIDDGKHRFGARVLNNVDMANLPYDKVWVEGDLVTRVQAQIDIGSMADVKEVDRSNYGNRYGLLLERVHADDASLYRVTYMNGPEEAVHHAPLSLAGYYVDTQGLGRLPRVIAAIVKHDQPVDVDYGKYTALQDILDGMAWGTTSAIIGSLNSPNKLAFAVNDELRRRGTGTIEKRFGRSMKLPDEKALRVVMELAMEQAGTLRFITTALAMINNIPLRYTPVMSKGGHSYRGRNLPFLGSETITIRAGRTKNLRRYLDHMFAMARRRRHSVRGFWRNVEYGTVTKPCEHVAVERDGNYALCGKCEHLLRWIDHHERGDATLGYVDHDYEVTR